MTTTMYEDEEFKTIDDFPDYQISNYGRVLSNRWATPSYIKTSRAKLVNDKGKISRPMINRLVIQYFKPIEDFRKYIVKHLDGDNENNHVDNLECQLRKKVKVLKPVCETEDLPNEEWKVIEAYPDYQVSNMGRVKSFKLKKERLLKANSGDPYKYSSVFLSNKGERSKKYYTHRLVAQYFLPVEDPELTSVSHINKDRSDNRLSNLKYVLPTDPEDYRERR